MKGDRRYNKNIEELILNAAYTKPEFAGRWKIRKILKNDPEAARLYKEVLKVKNGVNKSGREDVPRDFEANVFAKAGISNKRYSGITRPAFTFTATLAAVVLTIMVIFNTGNNKTKSYSEQELKELNTQAVASLAMVSRIVNKSSRNFGREIIQNEVSRPVNESMKIVNSILTKGDIK